jgi:hypothetical protein
MFGGDDLDVGMSSTKNYQRNEVLGITIKQLPLRHTDDPTKRYIIGVYE